MLLLTEVVVTLQPQELVAPSPCVEGVAVEEVAVQYSTRDDPWDNFPTEERCPAVVSLPWIHEQEPWRTWVFPYLSLCYRVISS